MSELEWTGERLLRARLAARMSQGDVRAKLVQARRRRGAMPPKDTSLKRMYTDWENGRVLPTEWRDELCEVFGLPPAALGFVQVELPEPLLDVPELFAVTRLDPVVVKMLDEQTNHYRALDRLLGAALIPQTEAHVRHLERLAVNSLPGPSLESAGVVLAGAAALTGWQALDAGDPRKAWDMHDVAKQAARMGNNPATLAYVTAQQAYVLLDAGRPTDAVELAQYARTPEALSNAPARLRAWLAAAAAEFLSAAGDESGALRMLDQAQGALPPGDTDPDLPYLMLNNSHLARWRGHCLARLGRAEAIDELTSALGAPELSSRRAESTLRVDLALAFRKLGDSTSSVAHAREAAELAGSAGSARQRARIARLVAA